MDVKALLNQMTLEQKVAHLSQFIARCIVHDEGGDITGPSRNLSLTDEELASCGSVLNVAGAEHSIATQKRHLEMDPNKIPLLIMHDVIHGWRTLYPIQLGLGATWDTDIVERCSRMSAREASAGGVHVTFAPMVDLVRDARWGRNMESCGEDPYLCARMSEAQVKGFQGDLGDKTSVCACVKHFAAYGAAEGGRDYNSVDMSEHTLREYYLPAYKAAVDAGVGMVMASFNTINGVPSIANKWLLDDILRGEWGFNGPIISDYSAFRELKNHGFSTGNKESARLAIEATADIEMMSNCYVKNLCELVAEGVVKESQIDECVLRILELKNKLGLFENPYRNADPELEKALALCEEHRAIVREAAEKSAVLLKNDGVLPLSADLTKIAIIGPYANMGMIGSWACHGIADEAVTVYEGVRALNPNATITLAEGFKGDLNEEPDYKMIKEAVKVAKKAQAVILCIGELSEQSGEARSRADINMSKAQIELVKEVCKANKNTVCVVFNGRPIILTDIIDTVPAIFTAWQPGTEGGNAIANLIFGKANFEGKLPMTFPRHQGQVPLYYNYLNTGRPVVGAKSRFYSGYIDETNDPLFPFGHGLSYSSFEIGKPELSANEMTREDSVTVSIKVKNTSDVAGKATLQLYIRDLYASLTRPVKELKAFKKLSLDAGEEQTVSFEITEEMLKFHTASGKYEAENGEFRIFVSDCSNTEEYATLILK